MRLQALFIFRYIKAHVLLAVPDNPSIISVSSNHDNEYETGAFCFHCFSQ